MTSRDTDSAGGDLRLPFRLDAANARGRLVRLGPALESILSRHGYPEAVSTLLGEALTLATLLAGALKYKGIFTLQAQGQGPVSLIVADVTSAGVLRGYARFDADYFASGRFQAQDETLGRAPERAGPEGAMSVPRLMGPGHLAFTVDQGPDTDRYQGVVALTGVTLADCAHQYFRQSEQIPTQITLACARREEADGKIAWRAGGLMLQRLPQAAPSEVAALAEEEDADAWRRAAILMHSVTADELTDPALTPQALLFRLFHEERAFVDAPQALNAGCRCSRGRVGGLLRSFPRDEIESMKVDGQIEVVCEFCRSVEVFDDAALDALFGGPKAL